MNLMQDYLFVDCLLVNFEIERDLSGIRVIVESYYPLVKDEPLRKLGKLMIEIQNIQKLNATIGNEFFSDLLINENYKANEIYELIAMVQDDGGISVKLKSDFLQMDLACKIYAIKQLD